MEPRPGTGAKVTCPLGCPLGSSEVSLQQHSNNINNIIVRTYEAVTLVRPQCTIAVDDVIAVTSTTNHTATTTTATTMIDCCCYLLQLLLYN